MKMGAKLVLDLRDVSRAAGTERAGAHRTHHDWVMVKTWNAHRLRPDVATFRRGGRWATCGSADGADRADAGVKAGTRPLHHVIDP